MRIKYQGVFGQTYTVEISGGRCFNHWDAACDWLKRNYIVREMANDCRKILAGYTTEISE